MAMMSCCYSKLEELEAELNSDMSFFGKTETELQQQLVAPDYYYDDDNQLFLGFDSNFFSSDTFLDYNPSFWEEGSNSSQYNSLLPSTAASSSQLEIFPAAAANDYCNYGFYDSYKRQKVYEEEESFLNYSDNDFFIPNMNSFFEEPTLSQGIFVGPFLDHFGSNPLTYYNNNSSSISSTITSTHQEEDVNEKKPAAGAAAGGGKNLSAQSIAARQRRRKITEKTQELGKLIPGGNRMNTADMFQAAYKYIKFMQAQVGILQILQVNLTLSLCNSLYMYVCMYN